VLARRRSSEQANLRAPVLVLREGAAALVHGSPRGCRPRGLGDGDGLSGLRAAFDEDLSTLEDIGAGAADPGFADELGELDVPSEGEERR
jgi:hypothetical protein